MTNNQAVQILKKSLAALEAANQESLPTSYSGNAEVKAFRIPTNSGSVVVKEDGTVVIKTNDPAHFSESIKRFDKGIGMISGLSGEVCNACNGTGRM